MFFAPGIVAWAINGAQFKRDRKKMITVISGGWGIPIPAAEALVLKKVPYIVTEDDAVQFHITESN
jgi:hypothetical protein